PLGQTITLKADADFQVMGLSGSGKVSAPLVFDGYGAVARDIGYDDYKGLDVAGKMVGLLRKTPRYNNPQGAFGGPRQGEHARPAQGRTRRSRNQTVVGREQSRRGSDRRQRRHRSGRRGQADAVQSPGTR